MSDPTDDLHHNALLILGALDDFGGETHTTNIRAITGLSAPKIGHHTDSLSADGLIRQTGTTDVGAPIPANVYALTDEGAAVADEIGSVALETPIHERVERLETRVNSQDDRLQEMQDALESIVDHLEDHPEDHADGRV